MQPTKMNLTELSRVVHAANAKWWQNIDTGEPIKRNKGELLALIHSEISEGYYGDQLGLMDDKLPHRLMAEVELVDAAIRIFDYSAGFGHDIGMAGLRVGISSFESLDKLIDQVMPRPVDVGFSDIHLAISNVLELERKGKPSEQVAEGLVDCLAKIFQMGSECEFDDMQGAFDEKMAYNAQRADHTHEARKIAGGKQF